MLRFLNWTPAGRPKVLGLAAPRRPALWLAVSAILIAGALAGGYLFGAQQSAIVRVQLKTLSQQNQALREESAMLRQRLADSELALKVEREAGEILQGSMQSSHAQMQALQEENAFYKSLMAPSSLNEGLSIAELELTATEAPRTYKYRIMLTQAMERPSEISGSLRMQLAGRRQGREQSFQLSELTDAETYPLPFQFRYFQNLSGTLTLPEGFQPQRLLVAAKQSNGSAESLTRSFDWAVSGVDPLARPQAQDWAVSEG